MEYRLPPKNRDTLAENSSLDSRKLQGGSAWPLTLSRDAWHLAITGFAANGFRINASQFLGAPLYLINEDWYNAWIAFTKQSWGVLTMTMTQWWAPTIVRISGDSTVRGQLIKTLDGSLVCDFPERMVLIANHQIYTDWLYLWWIGYAAGMHGRIYVILKESLKRIPVLGWGMQFCQFIFLKRKWEKDKPRMAAHLQKFNKRSDPMWLMMFPEGTNLADSTREASKRWAEKNGIEDMRHTLLPRSTGLQFVLQELKDTVDYVYDCTIVYEGVSRGEFAQDIFTVGSSYFGGRPPKSVNMYWRRFQTSSIPINDPPKFEVWLRNRWREKDKFIEDYLRTGRFPADKDASKDSKGQVIRGAGHIEAEVKPRYWYEFLQVFAPIGLFALVLYMFYGKLPAEVLKKIKSIDQKTVVKQIDAYQKGQINIPTEKELGAKAVKVLEEQDTSQGSKLRNAALAHGIVTLNGVPQKDFPAKGLESMSDVKEKNLPTKKTPTKKVSTKTKAIPKAPTFRKPVTLNGVPLNDFPAKGLGDTVSSTQRETEKATMQARRSSKALAPASSVRKLPANPPKFPKSSKKEAGKKPTSLQPSTHPEKRDKDEVFGTRSLPSAPNPAPKPPTKISEVEPKAASALSKGAPLRNPGKTLANSVSRKSEVASRASTASQPRDLNPVTILTSEASSEKQLESADVRRARKKLELRQGKHEPKRKTRRALETSAATS